MQLTTQSLQGLIDLPVSMPLTLVRSSDWLVVASFKLQQGQTLTYRQLALSLLDASISGVSLPLANQCNQFNVQLVNNSYGLAYIGIAKGYSVNTDPASVTWVGTAADVVSATSVGLYTRPLTALPLVISDPGDYSFVLVNNCATNLTSNPSTNLTNIDMKLVVTGQIRLST